MQTRDILNELRPGFPGILPVPPAPKPFAPEPEAATSTPIPGSQHTRLKFALHRKLLDRIDLQSFSQMPTDLMRAEIRPVVATLIAEEKTPISLGEREQLIDEVLDEVFGLGPLEPLLR